MKNFTLSDLEKGSSVKKNGNNSKQLYSHEKVVGQVRNFIEMGSRVGSKNSIKVSAIEYDDYNVCKS